MLSYFFNAALCATAILLALILTVYTSDMTSRWIGMDSNCPNYPVIFLLVFYARHAGFTSTGVCSNDNFIDAFFIRCRVTAHSVNHFFGSIIFAVYRHYVQWPTFFIQRLFLSERRKSSVRSVVSQSAKVAQTFALLVHVKIITGYPLAKWTDRTDWPTWSWFRPPNTDREAYPDHHHPAGNIACPYWPRTLLSRKAVLAPGSFARDHDLFPEEAILWLTGCGQLAMEIDSDVPASLQAWQWSNSHFQNKSPPLPRISAVIMPK